MGGPSGTNLLGFGEGFAAAAGPTLRPDPRDRPGRWDQAPAGTGTVMLDGMASGAGSQSAG